MAFSDADIQQAAQILANSVRQLTGRIEALESKPQVDKMANDWNEGRQYARQKGYAPEDLNRLEETMQNRGIMRHEDAIALDPVKPSPRGMLLGGLPKDELDMLLRGEIDAFEALSVSRALRGE